MAEVSQNGQTGRRTAPRDVRRKQLIMAAIDSISKRGISDTTLKHVTEKAQLSHGVVNYHFESKEALYDATLSYIAKEHYDLWVSYTERALPDPASQLAAIVAADFDKRVCTPKKMAVWFAFWGQAKYRPNYMNIHSKYDNERYAEMDRLCADLIEDGKYKHLDSVSVTRTLESLIDGCWLELMLYPEKIKRSDSRGYCLQVLANFFPKHYEIDQLVSLFNSDYPT